jgi:hypothetical protein
MHQNRALRYVEGSAPHTVAPPSQKSSNEARTDRLGRGAELTSRAILRWSQKRRVEWLDIAPRETAVKRFHRKVRGAPS